MKYDARSVYGRDYSVEAVGLSVQIGLIVAILLYGLVLSAKIPQAYHFIANICAALAAVIFAYAVGLSFDAIGLGANVVLRGVLIAALVSISIMGAVFVVASIPPVRRYFTLMQHMKPNEIAYETAVRIPLSTALTEEILFRGVLLGVLFTSYSTITAVVICSLVFGLWHVLPSLNRFQADNNGTGSVVSKILYAGATVGTTAFAGVFFSWLRVLSGSILAPWLTHWSINASAMLASGFIAHRNTHRLPKVDKRSVD